MLFREFIREAARTELLDSKGNPALLATAALERRFVLNPAKALGELGVPVGSERSVQALYRIRDRISSEGDTLVFGYPIFIATRWEP